MTQLLSVYAQDCTLYFSELIDGDIKIRKQVYDKPIYAMLPTSTDTKLPTDQVELNQYAITVYNAQYNFEYQRGEPNGYITYIRDTELHKDVFVCYGTNIVHVQDYEEQTKEDKVVNEIIDAIKYTEHDPMSFIELANERLAANGIDLEKELEKMVFEQPKQEEETTKE